MVRNQKIALVLALLALIFLAGVIPVQAQGAELRVSLRKNFGFSAGNRMQGAFTIRAAGPDDLARVTFYIGDQVLGVVEQAPFNLAFNTDSYPLGTHTLRAVGVTTGGQELASNELRMEFVSEQATWDFMARLIVPLLIVLAIVFGLTALMSVRAGKKLVDLPLGTERKYGFSGGAICPRCKRPFPQRFWGINIGVRSKFERCPFCGKWGAMKTRSLAELRAAEAAELETAAGQAAPMSEEERLRKAIDESRYQS